MILFNFAKVDFTKDTSDLVCAFVKKIQDVTVVLIPRSQKRYFWHSASIGILNSETPVALDKQTVGEIIYNVVSEVIKKVELKFVWFGFGGFVRVLHVVAVW